MLLGAADVIEFVAERRRLLCGLGDQASERGIVRYGHARREAGQGVAAPGFAHRDRGPAVISPAFAQATAAAPGVPCRLPWWLHESRPLAAPLESFRACGRTTRCLSCASATGSEAPRARAAVRGQWKR